MDDQMNGRTPIPAADPAQGYGLAIDAAIASLRRAVSSARENGANISAAQDAEVRSILTP